MTISINHECRSKKIINWHLMPKFEKCKYIELDFNNSKIDNFKNYIYL